MSQTYYKENCFSIYCNRCSISLKFYLEFCFLPLAVLGNKHILFALLWFDNAHKNTKMCLPTDRLLLSRTQWVRDKSRERPGPSENQASRDFEETNTLAKAKSLGQDDVTLSGLARPGRWAFVLKWRLPMPNFRLLWRQISWDRVHFRSWNFGE